ncbi:MAG: hypothetical protein WAJ99_07735 [Candidatus Sulfotelmatobacter sp.]
MRTDSKENALLEEAASPHLAFVAPKDGQPSIENSNNSSYNS